MATVLEPKTAAEINAANERSRGADGTGKELPPDREKIGHERGLVSTTIKGLDGKDKEVTEHNLMGMPNDKVLAANHVSETNVYLNMNHEGGRQQNAKGKEHPVYLQKFKCAFCKKKFNHLLQSLCTDEKHVGYDTHVKQDHASDLQKLWLERAGRLTRKDVVYSKAEEFQELQDTAESQAEEIKTLKAQMETLIAINKPSEKKD